MTRMKIMFETTTDIQKFVNGMQTCGCKDDFSIENEDGHYRAEAKSLLGVMYASGEFDSMYVVNETNDGFFPAFLEQFRA